jgi:uncharacterized protein YegP (UPF0339 family)
MATTAQNTVPRPLDAPSTVLEVYQDNGSRFRWQLVANDGRRLGHSHEGFSCQRDAQQAAEAARECMGAAPIHLDGTSGNPFFGGSS